MLKQLSPFERATSTSSLDKPARTQRKKLYAHPPPQSQRTITHDLTGEKDVRVKARTAITFPHNLPALFHVNILWTEQKWQNQSISPEPTQRGIERLTEIDDIPAGILHGLCRPHDWNRQRFIVRVRTLAPLDCLDFFLCAPAYLFPSSSPACSIRMLIWFYIPRGLGIMQLFAWFERNHQHGAWYPWPKWSLMFTCKTGLGHI